VQQHAREFVREMGNTFTDKDIASQMLQAQCISAGDPRLATKQEAESTGTFLSRVLRLTRHNPASSYLKSDGAKGKRDERLE
jgi:hypothetical protein